MSEIKYALSDHSPLVLTLEVCPPSTLSRAPWKLNALWLNLFLAQAQIGKKIADFWQDHVGQPDAGVVWETFKAFLRGMFIREIKAFKRTSSAQLGG